MIHQGRNIKRFRDLFGIKQEAMATALGWRWNQKKVSVIEAKEVVGEEVLERIAKILNVPIEAIIQFDEQKARSFIQSSFDQQKVELTSQTIKVSDKVSIVLTVIAH